MARQRERIIWSPVWSDEYKNWSSFFNRKNKWRCNRILDEDDLLQEAYLVFHNIKASYPRVVEPKLFMGLFKRAMINKMHDRSCSVRRRKDTVEAPVSLDVYEFFAGRIGETTNSGYLAAILNEAPEELKLVLAMLAKGDFASMPPKRRGRFEERKNLSMRICETLGLPSDYDPLAELKRLLTA